MPFKSEAQRRWMHAQKPAMAARWEKETPPAKLPARAPHPATRPKPPTRRSK